MENNPQAPHRALITILAEVHELTPIGQCRGIIVHKDRKLLQLDGQDKELTIKRLSEMLQELQNKCQSR